MKKIPKKTSKKTRAAEDKPQALPPIEELVEKICGRIDRIKGILAR